MQNMTTEGKIWQDFVRYDMVRLSKIWLDMKSKIRQDLARYDKLRLGKIKQDMKVRLGKIWRDITR